MLLEIDLCFDGKHITHANSCSDHNIFNVCTRLLGAFVGADVSNFARNPPVVPLCEKLFCEHTSPARHSVNYRT
jgi:hypothetical protein